jgi:hypothetical protein
MRRAAAAIPSNSARESFENSIARNLYERMAPGVGSRLDSRG